MNLNPNATVQILQSPFFHIVLDDVFVPEELEPVLAEWPGPDEEAAAWGSHDQPQEQKWGWGGWRSDADPGWPCPTIRDVTDTLVTDKFVEFLTLQTHIPGLVADPLLNGGGAHEIRTSGFLFTHIDFTAHPADYGDPGFLGTGRRLQRRLNVILYLNKDWKPEYGGNLELWSSKRVGYLQYEKGTDHVEYAPIFNRMVIFPTNARSFHGHPYPLNTPPGVTRKSIAAYYYTDGRPEEDEYEPHSTVFMETR